VIRYYTTIYGADCHTYVAARKHAAILHVQCHAAHGSRSSAEDTAAQHVDGELDNIRICTAASLVLLCCSFKECEQQAVSLLCSYTAGILSTEVAQQITLFHYAVISVILRGIAVSLDTVLLRIRETGQPLHESTVCSA
jgi:hypothetical protein